MLITELIKAAKRVYLIGNGGSAANAIHIANDLIAVGVRAHALTADVATLTAIANDYSYDDVFSRQLKVFGQHGDLLIALSGSGNSPNVIEAIETATRLGMVTAAVYGAFGTIYVTNALHTFRNGLDMQTAEEYQLWLGHEVMREIEKGATMKALILTWTGAQDHEIIFPYYRLNGAGFDVKIAADKCDAQGRFYGVFGCNMPCDIIIKDTDWFRFEFPDIVVLPGGVKALEKLRQEKDVLDWLTTYGTIKKGIVASTCHGAQMLISAGLVRGKTIASYPSIKDDVNNAGGTWSGDPVVVSENIVSSPHYDFMGPWMEEAIRQIYRHEYEESLKRVP